MKKLFIFTSMFLSFAAMAQVQPNEKPMIDALSTELSKDGLVLVTTGFDQPHTIEDDQSRIFTFDSVNGDELSYSYGKINNVCVSHSAPTFGELPVRLNNGSMARFYVPSITDKDSRSRDYLVFEAVGVCHEISYGYAGKGYKRAVQLANLIVGDSK